MFSRRLNSSQRDNRLSIYLVFISLAQNAGLFFCLQCVFDYLFAPAGPRSTAAAVSAKNMPQAYFLNASTVLKEIIAYRYILYLSASHKMRGCFFVCNVFSIISLLLWVLAAQLLWFRLKICHRHIFQTPQQFSKSNALSIYFVFISLAQNAGLFL